MSTSSLDLLLHNAAVCLQGGGVVLHATEGVWGFACDPCNETAVHKILAIKGRSADKGLILIAADAQQFASALGKLEDDHAQQVRDSWPGHHTWVLPNQDYSVLITGGRPTVAARVPGHDQARQLCVAFGGALVSTSANRAGEPAAVSYRSATKEFETEVDFVLPGEVGEAGRSSTIHAIDGQVLR